MPGRCRVGMLVQSVAFSRPMWTPGSARAWLGSRGWRDRLETTRAELRARQVSPTAFVRGSFRSIALTDGVRAIVGCPKTSNPSDAVDAYRDFHWGNAPTGARRVTVPPVTTLYELGELREVVYRTRKGRETADWHHEFAAPRPTLTATARGRLGPILGGGYRIGPRGIVR